MTDLDYEINHHLFGGDIASGGKTMKISENGSPASTILALTLPISTSTIITSTLGDDVAALTHLSRSIISYIYHHIVKQNQAV